MKTSPLFSVIMVTYNSSDFINIAIQSVLNSSYEDFEFIICDDCSSDNTWDLINFFKDKRIKAIQNEKNIGEYPNRNKAIDIASGEYLIFIDGDDVIFPHALEMLSYYTKCFAECVMLIGRQWDSRILPPYKIDPVEFYRFHFFDTSLIGASFVNVLFKTEFLKLERLPEMLSSGDVYIQLRLTQKNPALIIPSGFSWWRKTEHNATSKLMKNKRYLAEVVKYEIELLSSINCPLSENEVEIAKINIYGGFLRIIFREILFFKLKDAVYLLRLVKIPNYYWIAFFVPSKRDFYSNILGNKPLTSIK